MHDTSTVILSYTLNPNKFRVKKQEYIHKSMESEGSELRLHFEWTKVH